MRPLKRPREIPSPNPAFEREVLAALLRPEFYRRWGRALPVSVLSPHGQRLARAIQFAHKASSETPAKGKPSLSLPEIITSLRRENQRVPEEVKALAKEVTEIRGAHADVSAALAEEVLRRGKLDALMEQATTQLQLGKVDLDALAKTLRGVRLGEDVVRDFDAATAVDEEANLPVLPTPWKSVNQEIGGLYPRELGMVMGSPKAGKTGTMLNLVVGALDAKWNVLYITAADEGYGGLCRRLAGAWLDEPTRPMRRDPELALRHLGRCQMDWKKRGVRVTIADFTKRPCALADIERTMESAREEIGDAQLAVFIDRLEEAIPAERTGEVRRDIEGNYATARMFARRYCAPVWVDSQAAIKENDEGWVDLTRGAEARVGKAKTVDLCLGMGVHPEDDNTLRVTLTGRRDIRRRRMELRRDPETGLIYE